MLGRFYENRLVARQVVKRQLNHNITFLFPVQKFSFLGVNFAILVTKGSPSYSKSTTDGWYTVVVSENPRAIMNGAYSCIFDTNIPGMRHVLSAS